MKNNAILGIEFGSTRIKAVLINREAEVIAQGSYEWENKLEGGYWTYSLEEVVSGMQQSYREMAKNYRERFLEDITGLDSIGISAMMHGYIALDENEKLLVPFRTWRNITAERAATELTELLGFHIPTRWTASHYYQAVIDKEEHVPSVCAIHTLASYVHYLLTGNAVIGIGDASGIFPVKGGEYDKEMLSKFNAKLTEKGAPKRFEDLIPKPLSAGENAGKLTEAGALLLDPTGKLKSGAVACPPEGDAGTGMVATAAVKVGTANVSAGTSAFLMAVLERDLSKCYKEIDVITTPAGAPVAMVHSNNFTSEINAWVELFSEVLALGGSNMTKGELYGKLFEESYKADADVGGIIGYNFLAAEPIVGARTGALLYARRPDARFDLATFMKTQIYASLGAIRTGYKILAAEGLSVSSVIGHGGFFKTPKVGQSAMSAALGGAPVTVMKTAGEGGAWGIAALALFTLIGGGDLEEYIDSLFSDAERTTLAADATEIDSFNTFMENYYKGLSVQKAAGEIL